jgi:hypothetical protein
MDDKQFNALRTLILDVKVEIKDLALAVRTLEKRITSIEAKVGETGPDIYSTEDMIPVFRTSPRPGPRSDSE